jgi:hypothetical protein
MAARDFGHFNAAMRGPSAVREAYRARWLTIATSRIRQLLYGCALARAAPSVTAERLDRAAER